MASFSFGTGNAAKLLRMPMYAIGRIGTLIVPRGRTWVFGCGAGIGDGALALHREATMAGHRTLWLVRSPREQADARALGIRTRNRDGLLGWWATARAGVIVVTHGLGDVNRYASSGGFVVQLWHGIPLKRIGLDSPVTVQVPAGIPAASLVRRLLTSAYRAAAQRIRVLPAASHRSRGRLESAFGLGDDRVVVTGEPRVDVLSAGGAAERRAAASALLTRTGPLLPSQRTLLYAPTWRDGATDPAVPRAAEWVRIVRMLEEHDAILFIRSHPLGEGVYSPPWSSGRVRMLSADLLPDATPALPRIDTLITDYSSMAYDVGLLAMPVVYLAPDAEEYGQERGFYGSYTDVAGDDYARSWEEAIDQLDQLLGDAGSMAARAARSTALSAQIHAYNDGHNTRRVYQAIRARGISAPKGER
ncbi:CDP-glycerol:poly(glycerophosphate) glycerophosphotransferase [Microbacterium esteraromaticum]|uniref:CDP-glycerol:poly(Glycerophosphate) glycerophosphotransferase n=1 Tax=Microbacterium esteraromaticum TaxID=57043 RepID=A0A1R4JE75_9MICO|nr:CDP-glycerol glycerophosphotransferase family protein [Microbacterium esteraromaticum]SJN30312.1 CDP-glycerol:poly(glycerophosphate) glycerophosphotransferase [Microbacterium esteraromaticum]